MSGVENPLDGGAVLNRTAKGFCARCCHELGLAALAGSGLVLPPLMGSGD